MRTVAVVFISALAFTASAIASPKPRYYVPRAHHACRAHYVHRWVHVRRHGRMVRQGRCMYVAPKSKPTPLKTPAPASLSVRAGIDPAYTQDSNDPLHVTWTYSASATNGTLPDGVLSLTVTLAGQVGPAGQCSMNVGGAITGGTCTLELPQYGTYDVVTSYADSTATVAPSSSTDVETFSAPPAPPPPPPPGQTTTSATVAPDPSQPCTTQDNGSMTFYACGYIATAAVSDQAGNPLSPPQGSIAFHMGNSSFTPSTGLTCHFVITSRASDTSPNIWGPYAQSSDCGNGSPVFVGPGPPFNGSLVASTWLTFAGMSGYLPSSSGNYAMTA